MTIALIIITEICKAPTLRLKALNKHTHIMYIEKCYQKRRKEISTRVFKHYARYTLTHTHTLYRLIGVKDNAA